MATAGGKYAPTFTLITDYFFEHVIVYCNLVGNYFVFRISVEVLGGA